MQDVVAEQPERFFVAEIVREKILLQYYQEVPYATAVRPLHPLDPAPSRPWGCQILSGGPLHRGDLSSSEPYQPRCLDLSFTDVAISCTSDTGVSYPTPFTQFFD